MKHTLLPFLLALGLGYSAGGLADKPSWAGEGGRPTTAEKQQHKEEMTSKHENKDNAKQKSKNKEKEKKKEKQPDHDKDQDRDQDRDRDRDGG